jgi:hypothetical protein
MAQRREQYSPDHHARLGRALLVGHGLEELADPEAASVAGSAPSRQGVVGADHLVAVGDVGLLAEEQRAVVGEPLQEPAGVFRQHLDMLVGRLVGLGDRLFEVVDQQDLATIAPRDARHLGGRQHGKLALDLGRQGFGQPAAGGDQHGGRGRPVLGLAQKVGRDHLRVRAVVGDHQDLGRAGQKVDADPAEQLALGLGDIGVAWADQHVDRPYFIDAVRHRADRLDPAQKKDFVGAAERHRGDGLGVRSAIGRRRAGDDPLHARDLGGDDAHVGRRDHRIAAARHVAADARDRDALVAEGHARQGGDLDVLERVLLRLRKAADLRLGERDVVDRLLGDAGDKGIDLGLAQAKAGRVPPIESFGVRAHRLVAARLNIGKDAAHGLAHLLAGGGDRLGFLPAFQIDRHACPLAAASS